jgi:hypothetical protein
MAQSSTDAAGFCSRAPRARLRAADTVRPIAQHGVRLGGLGMAGRMSSSLKSAKPSRPDPSVSASGMTSTAIRRRTAGGARPDASSVSGAWKSGSR